MAEDNLESLASQPDVCRCCLSTNGTMDMTASHTINGIEEVYSEMIQECFGLALSYQSEYGLSRLSRLICVKCVEHLRDAFRFRKQVVQAETLFVRYCTNIRGSLSLTIKTEESEEVHLNDCFTDDFPEWNCDDIKNTSSKSKTSEKMQRKRPTRNAKMKRTRKKIQDDDSDTPISKLSKKSEINSMNSEMSQNDVDNINNTEERVDISNKEPLRRKNNKLLKMSALNYVENRNLRSNISVILKNSTLVPFKYVNNKYVCLDCEEDFLIFKELKEHNNKHSDVTEIEIILKLKTPKNLIKADISDIKCKICEESLRNIESLIDHLTIRHKKVYNRIPRLNPSHGILGFVMSSEKLRCHICNREFTFFKNLSIHMNEHSNNFMCHVCGKKFLSNHRLQTHVLIHKSTEVKCKHCGKDFLTVSARSYHIRKKHNESKFKCPDCPLVFAQYQHRLKHLVEKHKVRKPEFKCDICLKEYASSGGLRAHIRYTHLKNKEFSCEICGKVFVYKWIWQRHLDTHSAMKTFECKYCFKKFAKLYTLQMHVRIHLNDKRFSCTFCKLTFVQKCSLKNHIRVHHSDAGVDLTKL